MFLKKSVSAAIQQKIKEFLQEYRSEVFPHGVLSLTSSLEITHTKAAVVVEFSIPFPCDGELEILSTQLSELLGVVVIINANTDVAPVRRHNIKGATNIIAVSSGKGGVGKSTTAVNLAYALMAEGAQVGILDADIYGPSIPTLMGLQGQRPTSADGVLMTPLEANGLHCMSIGLLVDSDDATIWRGPMASKAFNQMINETAWPELDYLIVDMPPGTGDIQLTLAQKVPVAAALVITTPQDIALIDAKKGIAMFDKVTVPVLGIIENMSYHLCENCGHQSYLFGKNGGVNVAHDYETPLLGQVPLNISIREDADNGLSPIMKSSTSEIALLYRKIARSLASQLFLQLDARSPETTEISVKEL